MDNKVLTFEQFLKHKSPSDEVKGTSKIVKDHYASEKDVDLNNPISSSTTTTYPSSNITLIG